MLESRVRTVVHCLSTQAEDALSAEQRNCPFTLETLKECMKCMACTLSNEGLYR